MVLKKKTRKREFVYWASVMVLDAKGKPPPENTELLIECVFADTTKGNHVSMVSVVVKTHADGGITHPFLVTSKTAYLRATCRGKDARGFAKGGSDTSLDITLDEEKK